MKAAYAAGSDALRATVTCNTTRRIAARSVATGRRKKTRCNLGDVRVAEAGGDRRGGAHQPCACNAVQRVYNTAQLDWPTAHAGTEAARHFHTVRAEPNLDARYLVSNPRRGLQQRVEPQQRVPRAGKHDTRVDLATIEPFEHLVFFARVCVVCVHNRLHHVADGRLVF